SPATTASFAAPSRIAASPLPGRSTASRRPSCREARPTWRRSRLSSATYRAQPDRSRPSEAVERRAAAGDEAEADVADEALAMLSVIGIADHVVAIVHEDQAAAAVVGGILPE